MLTSVRLQGFKSFTDATVKLAPLTVLIGANGSGKSNFLDALRIIGRTKSGHQLGDAIRGNAGLGITEIRGGIRAVSNAQSSGFKLTYSLSDGTEEWLQRFSAHDTGLGEQPGLDHVLRQKIQISDSIRFRFLQLLPDVLRRYSSGSNEVDPEMEEDGAGFALLVSKVCLDQKRKIAYIDWLSELRPEHITDVEVKEGAVGDLMFGVVEKDGHWLAAPSLSDGTLRFAGLVAALFQQNKPTIICIEEIENGMHPARLRLVLELLRAFVANGTQVIVTTHAPWLLAWLSKEELAATQIFYRGEDGSSQVKSCGEHEFLKDALKNTPIEELFAEGYLEQTL